MKWSNRPRWKRKIKKLEESNYPLYSINYTHCIAQNLWLKAFSWFYSDKKMKHSIRRITWIIKYFCSVFEFFTVHFDEYNLTDWEAVRQKSGNFYGQPNLETWQRLKPKVWSEQDNKITVWRHWVIQIMLLLGWFSGIRHFWPNISMVFATIYTVFNPKWPKFDPKKSPKGHFELKTMKKCRFCYGLVQ